MMNEAIDTESQTIEHLGLPYLALKVHVYQCSKTLSYILFFTSYDEYSYKLHYTW